MKYEGQELPVGTTTLRLKLYLCQKRGVKLPAKIDGFPGFRRTNTGQEYYLTFLTHQTIIWNTKLTNSLHKKEFDCKHESARVRFDCKCSAYLDM